MLTFLQSKALAGLLVLLGILCLALSLKMNPYKDQAYFNKEYAKMKHGDSRKYFELRDSQLTAKYRLQDYGVSGILAGGILFLLNLGAGLKRGLRTKWRLLLLAIATPFASVIGYTFDLVQGQARGEFPHWADSLGIPLLGVPFELVLFTGVALVFFFSIRKIFVPDIELKLAFKRTGNNGFPFILAIIGLVTMISAVYGQYYYVVPGFLWFYLILLVGAHRIGYESNSLEYLQSTPR